MADLCRKKGNRSCSRTAEHSCPFSRAKVDGQLRQRHPVTDESRDEIIKRCIAGCLSIPETLEEYNPLFIYEVPWQRCGSKAFFCAINGMLAETQTC